MVDVFKIRKGDTIKFRNGEVHTITKVANISVSKGRKSITICIERCGKEDCYTYEITGGLWWPDCRTESSWDIVEHIPRKENNMIFEKKTFGHQPRKLPNSSDKPMKRPDPSVGSAAVKPTQPAQDEMTMRDQFAMAAMSGRMARDGNYPSSKGLATIAYDIADEMMKARKENN